MTKLDFSSPQELVAHLRNFTNIDFSRSGVVFYSGFQTLRRGDFMLLGFNPGGTPSSHSDQTLDASLNDFLVKNHHNYVEGIWPRRTGGFYAAGQSPLQVSIKRFFAEAFGPKIDLKEVFSTNLVFYRSRDASGVDQRMKDVCWPVHELCLEIVQPKVVVTIGNSSTSSAYVSLRERANAVSEFAPELSGHGNAKLKSFLGTLVSGQRTLVLGLPHLSRFTVNYMSPGFAVIRQRLEQHLTSPSS
jgi:hypothetical protein